jgi:hypothetical protein
MTALEHNKFVGLAQLGYAAIHLLMIVGMIGFMGFMMLSIFSQAERMGDNEGRPMAFVGAIWAFVGLFNLVLTIPSVVAGYALLKRKSWAKVAAIIGAALAAMSVPIGTLVAVYTFWFLFSEPGRQLYDQRKEIPPPPPGDWTGVGAPSRDNPGLV